MRQCVVPAVSNIWNLTNAISQVLAAIGTIGAVVLALFLQVVIVRRRRPELFLDFSDSLHREDVLLMDQDADFDAYIRMKVRSKRGRRTAKNVEVLLLRLERPANAPWRGVVPSLQLKWSDVPFRNVDIPAGSWRRFDLVQYWAEKNRPKRRILLPALNRPYDRFPPSQRHHLVDTGTYSLFLAITGDEIDTKVYTVSFHFKPAPATNAKKLLSQITQIEWHELSVKELDEL